MNTLHFNVSYNSIKRNKVQFNVKLKIGNQVLVPVLAFIAGVSIATCQQVVSFNSQPCPFQMLKHLIYLHNTVSFSIVYCVRSVASLLIHRIKTQKNRVSVSIIVHICLTFRFETHV